MGFLLLVNMAGKASWLEQVLEALNAGDKNLLSKYRYRLFKFLESAQRTSMQNFEFFLVKKMVYPEISDQEYGIPASMSYSTIVTFVALK